MVDMHQQFVAENRRQPDQGDGTYVNPILGGDYPDPSVLRVGRDYYMTHSSFRWAPALLIWHSRDLVNWRPVCNALTAFDGDVWAPELCEHGGRFFIYYKTSGGNHVVHADAIDGPWQNPVDLKVGYIDPGHVVDTDGTRYLHLSAGMAVKLADDGLSVEGKPFKVMDAWPLPEDWRTEGVCLEGPKLLKRGDWYYCLIAQAGTAGPATSHAVIAARSRSALGPWEWSPHNPIVHTFDRRDRWWSRGHGTLIEGPGETWWVMVHAYENGYRTLGRQTLLEPVQWMEDGWFRVPEGVDPAKPIAMPPGEDVGGGLPLSDDFTSDKLGLQWRFFDGDGRGIYQVGGGQLQLTGVGQGVQEGTVVTCIPTEQAYEVEVDVEISAADVEAGLVLFYNRDCFAGLKLSGDGIRRFSRAAFARKAGEDTGLRRATLRLVNDHHEVDCHVRHDDGTWEKLRGAYETSGYHHNVFGGFISLRVGLYCAGQGSAIFRNFRYRGMR